MILNEIRIKMKNKKYNKQKLKKNIQKGYHYKCDRCGNSYINEVENEELRAEFEANFKKKIEDVNVRVVCDDCYQYIMLHRRLQELINTGELDKLQIK